MREIAGYQIREQINESATSQTFRAIRGADGLPLVLKVLNQDHPTPERIFRFRQEYLIVSRLQSVEGVIKVYDQHQVENTLVTVLEDCVGTALDELIRTRPLPLAECLDVAIAVVEILGGIHAARVVHKDINPSNIVFNQKTGDVRLIDFGLSTVLSRHDAAAKNPDTIDGSLPYMSPEQTGRMNRSIDYRSDYYSFGVTLYELLSGSVPFAADDSLEMVYAHIAQAPEDLNVRNPAVPRILSDIVMKLLAKNAEARYQSAAGIRADLEECRRGVIERGSVEPFPLARWDIPSRLEIPEKLYGRADEIGTLFQALERVTHGTRELILVSGGPGIGKTSLVRELHKPMTRLRGSFVSGKFDQFERNIPYAALTQAFGEFVRHLLTEPEDRLTIWKQRLEDALLPNGRIMVDLIPELELIIGPQPPAPELGPKESHNRFQFVFRRLIRAFCRSGHPVVLFLDDLQWADSPSLNLLELIMTDGEIGHLLLVGAYRDNETPPGHPLMAVRDVLENAGLSITDLALGPLSVGEVAGLIGETVHGDPALVDPLAAIVHRKTGGNPFFVREIMRSLYAEDLLRFDATRACWVWSLDRIAEQDITDNVVCLMSEKIRKLDDAGRRALMMAACIGCVFELDLLVQASGVAPPVAAESLRDAVDQGFVAPVGDEYCSTTGEAGEPLAACAATYSFCHDRIQQAAYSLIPEDERPALHRFIGRTLLGRDRPGQDDQHVFDTVNQLNCSVGLIDDRAERHELARLNLRAGQRAKTSAAYEPALEYLNAGIPLMGEDGWRDDYDLTAALHIHAMEAAFLTSRWDEMERLGSVILTNAASVLDQAKVYEIRIRACYALHRLSEAVEMAREILRKMGVVFPAKPSKAHALVGLIRLRYALRGRSVEALVDLPEMTDPVYLTITRILATVAAAAYAVVPELLPLIVFKLVDLSLRFGNGPSAPFGYSTLAIILCGPVGQTDEGYRFGKMSLELSDELGARDAKPGAACVFNFFARPWKEHLRDCIEPLLHTYHAGLDAGDVQYAAHARFGYSLFSFWAGKELNGVYEGMAATHDAMSQLNQDTLLHSLGRTHQAVANLLGHAQYPCRLVGEHYDSVECLPRFIEAREFMALFGIYFYEMFLCYVFEEYETAVVRAESARTCLDSVRGMIFVPLFQFYESLARLARCRAQSSAERKAAIAGVGSNQKKMMRWARVAPMNSLHKYYLVEAELYRVKGKITRALEHYEQAIALARRNRYLHDEALAYECAAGFFQEHDRLLIAKAYMSEARYRYEAWGASAKVQLLEERHGHLLSTPSRGKQARSGDCRSPSTSERGSQIGLDLESVLRASRAISREIDWPVLQKELIRIVRETAGAQRAALVLENEGRFSVEAEQGPETEDIIALQSEPVHASPRIASSIVNYVARTQEPVILDDASTEARFAGDSYIVENEPKSILCCPLVHQGHTTGIIYLENNLAAGTFTEDKIELLRVLSSQAAISLENARLYESRKRAEADLRLAHADLEDRVRERTAELTQANAELRNEIAEREKAEVALRESEQKYRFLAENAKDIMWIIDLDLNTTYINSSVKSVLGVDPQDRLAQSITDKLTPDSLARAQAVLAEELRRDKDDGVAPDRPVKLQLDFTRKNGSPVCLETVMSFIRDKDLNPVGVYGLSRDITERQRAEQAIRESERRLAQIIDFLPDATLVIDQEGTVVAWNRAIERMTGVPAERMIGRGDYAYAVPFYGEPRPILIDLVREEHPDVSSKYLSITQRGEKMVSESFHPLLQPGPAYLSGTASKLYDSEGKQVGAIESIRDITQIKQTEQALKEAKVAAEAATRAKSEFLATMSHEIRTPLNAIVGMVDLVLDADLTDDQRKRVAIIKASADALHALINDILDFSKIEAGKIELEDVDFPAGETFDRVMSIVRIRAKEKNLVLQYDASPDIPACCGETPIGFGKLCSTSRTMRSSSRRTGMCESGWR